MFLGQEGARRTLEAGVTTVRDMNAEEYVDIAMRNLVDSGDLLGPRMLVVGYGLAITWAETGPGTADGPDEVLRVVRRNVAAGVDWIKMFGSYGGGADLRDYQTFTYEEMKAAVDAAHNLGKRIAIHAVGQGSARDAVRAGTDSLEHGSNMDDETIQEMVRRGTFYVPTIDVHRYYAENGEAFGWSPGNEQRQTDFIERSLETARRAHAAGVRFAMGSDVVYTMYGDNTRELEWFVRAGMTPEEALATATTNAAEMLGMENEIGAIGPGYYADLVAIDGDPLSDVGAIISGVAWVMKAGRVVVDKVQ
jgi:imidazolonepropionase-like amidohydrolase